MAQNPQGKDDNPQVKITKQVTINGQIYDIEVEGTVDFKLTAKGGTIPDPEKPPVDPKSEKPSDFGTIKKGAKWTINPGNAETWILKNMDNPSTKFKFISANDNLNIIADINSKEDAIAIQNYFKVNVFPPKEDGGEVDPGTPETPADPTNQPATPDGKGPYPVKGKTYQSTQRGPTTRHYASGAPDDQTIEKNVTGIQDANHMMVVDITVPTKEEMEHDDNLSIKIGGNHMDNGWFDNGISIYEGQTCGGTEVKHPKTNKCIVKGKKYGDIRGKRIQVASTYFQAENKTEYWVNIPGVTQGWDKGMEGKDIGGFNSKTKEGKYAIQLRIDGFKEKNNPPKIHSAVAYGI